MDYQVFVYQLTSVWPRDGIVIDTLGFCVFNDANFVWTTTPGANNDDKVGYMTTLCFIVYANHRCLGDAIPHVAIHLLPATRWKWFTPDFLVHSGPSNVTFPSISEWHLGDYQPGLWSGLQ